MNRVDEVPEEMSYMIRRRFRIPSNEIKRDYRRHEILTADNILPCDYEDLSDDESFNE